MANKKQLIDAFSLTIRLSKKNAKRPLQYDDVLAIIADEKTVDAVEVVRCKDCKHYCQYPKVDKPKACFVHPLTPHFMPDDGFCSYGERRDNG